MLQTTSKLTSELLPTVGAKAIAVLLVIAEETNEHGISEIEQREIRERANLGRDVVSAAIRKLLTAKAITGRQTKDINTGKFKKPGYVLNSRYVLKIDSISSDYVLISDFEETLRKCLNHLYSKEREWRQINPKLTTGEHERQVKACLLHLAKSKPLTFQRFTDEPERFKIELMNWHQNPRTIESIEALRRVKKDI